MKTKIFALILMFICCSFKVFAQEETINESLNLVNTLTKNGITFRYSKDSTFNYHTDPNGSMDDEEKSLLTYIPDSHKGRLASLGLKFENISITLTHMEDYFPLENSSEDKTGELMATALGITIKKPMFWILYFVGGLDRTESTFKITPPGQSTIELDFANYAGTLGVEAGFEILEGVFVNLFYLMNQQLFDSGYLKGYDCYGLGVEIFSTD